MGNCQGRIRSEELDLIPWDWESPSPRPPSDWSRWPSVSALPAASLRSMRRIGPKRMSASVKKRSNLRYLSVVEDRRKSWFFLYRFAGLRMAYIFSVNDFAIRGHMCPPRLSRVLVNWNAQKLMHRKTSAFWVIMVTLAAMRLSGTCNLRSQFKWFSHIAYLHQ